MSIEIFLLNYLHSKKYIFKIVWGKQTDSDDAEGKIFNESKKRLEKYGSYAGNMERRTHWRWG